MLYNSIDLYYLLESSISLFLNEKDVFKILKVKINKVNTVE